MGADDEGKGSEEASAEGNVSPEGPSDDFASEHLGGDEFAGEGRGEGEIGWDAAQTAEAVGEVSSEAELSRPFQGGGFAVASPMAASALMAAGPGLGGDVNDGPGPEDGRGGGEDDGRPASEGEGEDGETKAPPRPSGRFLTTTIVLVTFIAALGGFLLNRASAASSNAGDLAQQLSLQGSAAETSAYQQAEADYSQYLSLQALQAKASQEMLEATYAQGSTQYWADLYRSAHDQVEQTASEVPSDLRPDLADGNPDPNFPYDFFAERAYSGTNLEAKSDAYNDVSDQWSKLVDAFTAILTMLAVALFLFGSAYVLYGRSRLLFTAVASLLVAVALVWGGILTLASQPVTPSAEAAADYANGVMAMSRASKPVGYQPAINDFSAAIALRPDYALAYSERAAAEALRGSQQIGAGFISNVAPYWDHLVAIDELSAYNLGEHDANQVLNVGYGYYSEWIADGGKGEPPPRAETFFGKAATLDPTNPVALLDLAISELAGRQFTAAAAMYRDAVTHMLFRCGASQVLSTCTQAQPTTSYGLQQAWLAGAMESLEALAQSQEGQSSASLRTKVTEMKAMLVASMAGAAVTTAPPPPGVGKVHLSGFVDPNFLELYVPVPSGVTALQLADRPVTVIWYERPVGARRWSAIPETACWGDGHQGCGHYDSSTNTFQFTTRFLAADNSCFTDVEYRAELYVEGTLDGSLSLSPADDYIGTNLSPALSKAMNMGICTPSSWRLRPVPSLTFRVYGTSSTVTGPLWTSELSYESPNAKRGVYIFRLYPPRTSVSGQVQSPAQLVQTTQEYVINLLKGRGLPTDLTAFDKPEPTDLWGGAVSDMTATAYKSASTGEEALVGAAIISLDGLGASASAQDKAIAGNVTEDDAVTVTVVYGPGGLGLWSGDHSLGVEVFSSWSLLNYG